MPAQDLARGSGSGSEPVAVGGLRYAMYASNHGGASQQLALAVKNEGFTHVVKAPQGQRSRMTQTSVYFLLEP